MQQDDWKKTYYGEKSSKKYIIIIIPIVLVIIVLAIIIYFYLPIKSSFNPMAGNRVSVGLSFSAADVNYPEPNIVVDNITTEENKTYHEWKEADEMFQAMIFNLTGNNWSSLVENPTDNKLSITATLLMTMAQGSVVGYHIVFMERMKNAGAFSDEEITSLTMEDVTTEPTRENLLKTIEGYKKLEEFYASKGLKYTDVTINRLNFLHKYFEQVGIPQGRVATRPYSIATIVDPKWEYATLVDNIITPYSITYRCVMTRINIIEAKNNLITLQNIGKVSLNMNDIFVYVGYLQKNCIWSADVANPNSIITCTLGESCSGKEIKVVSCGNSVKANCTT